MGYVLDLRKRVGHLPLVVAGAAMMAQNSTGKIVLIYRTDNHCWGLPAGSTEPGETVQQTARRELKEETGLTVGDLTLIDVFSGPNMHYQYPNMHYQYPNMHYQYPNGDVIDSVTTLYRANTTGGELIQATDETSTAAFFDLDDLPSPLTPLTKWMLKGE
ncbi:NUDIX domain-containing protein [Lactiplantibacillus pentosus]|uniref:NUDIX hydrolase n=1 Tax=Lactiplantibacillus pentosus TaxID=1589 RepID=UPI0021A68F67|nr:NUDIX domain-containing protein [Lactiplantibacillus pentosus]MCT3298906.1 NUDIX domain-containing protein [Lactiplantibacillus pentosus]